MKQPNFIPQLLERFTYADLRLSAQDVKSRSPCIYIIDLAY